MLIGIAVLLLLAAGTMLVYSIRKMTPQERRYFIPTPRGPLPVSTDSELLAARDMFPPEHGAERADGFRYCGECREWGDPLTWEAVEVNSGNEVTVAALHNCQRRAA